MKLRGRGQQRRALDGLLADARAGRSRVLVIGDEPGIGKTALLGYAADMAQDFQWPRRRVSSRRWSCRSRRCISCAGGCWVAGTGP